MDTFCFSGSRLKIQRTKLFFYPTPKKHQTLIKSLCRRIHLRIINTFNTPIINSKKQCPSESGTRETILRIKIFILLFALCQCLFGFQCGSTMENCYEDKDCPKDQACVSYACTDASSSNNCRSNQDCKSTHECKKGQCTIRTTPSCGGITCPRTHVCNPSSKKCEVKSNCKVDLDCRSTHTCDPTSKTCVPKKVNPCGNGRCEATHNENCSTCPKDCGCPSGQSCQAGTCKTPPNPCGNGRCESTHNENCSTCPKDCGCSANQNCQAGVCKAKPNPCTGVTCPRTHTCDASTAKCVPKTTCKSDLDCSAPHQCDLNAKKCVPKKADPCGNGRCEAAHNENCLTCPKDCKCAAGQVCQVGICRAKEDPCVKLNCPRTHLCVASIGKCVPKSGCFSDMDCKISDRCHLNKCVPRKNSCGNGKCEASLNENCASCPKDCKCPSGQSCQVGVCKAKSNPCTGVSCPKTHTCDSSTGKCVIKTPSKCKRDTDCPRPKVCDAAAGTCRSATQHLTCPKTKCPSLFMCTSLTFGKCIPKSTRFCQKDSMCNANEKCSAGICIPSKVRICGDGVCDLFENCKSCQKDCFCTNGAVCSSKGACVKLP